MGTSGRCGDIVLRDERDREKGGDREREGGDREKARQRGGRQRESETERK